jgi:hypothetical protein
MERDLLIGSRLGKSCELLTRGESSMTKPTGDSKMPDAVLTAVRTKAESILESARNAGWKVSEITRNGRSTLELNAKNSKTGVGIHVMCDESNLIERLQMLMS